MLVLTRKLGEQIQIGDEIQVTVTQLKGDRVRLGIAAPREIAISRSELGSHEPVTELEPVGLE